MVKLSQYSAPRVAIYRSFITTAEQLGVYAKFRLAQLCRLGYYFY